MRRLMLAGVLLFGCSDASAKIRMVPNVVAGTQSALHAGVGEATSESRIGSPLAINLMSLKYYITGIQLCQDVQLSGSGFSATHGCIMLYQSDPANTPNYDDYTVEEAQADNTPGHYIDLMTAEGQAALRRPVTLEVPVGKDSKEDAGPSPEGAYRYGMINFYRPIKVTAQFPIVGQPDQYFRTRAVSRIDPGPMLDGGHNTEKVEIGDALSGPTEETTYMLNNGGALFVFQKPFVITQADIDAQNEIKVDLVFNPDNFGQAYESENCLNEQFSAICDPLNNVVLDMPYVRMNPVPRKTGEKTRKETYLMDYDTHSKLRIELYYNDGDSEAGVQGVDAAVVYDAGATMPNNNVISRWVAAAPERNCQHPLFVRRRDLPKHGAHGNARLYVRRRQHRVDRLSACLVGASCSVAGRRWGALHGPAHQQGTIRRGDFAVHRGRHRARGVLDPHADQLVDFLTRVGDGGSLKVRPGHQTHGSA
jgi:hypothetical protein